MKFQNSRPSIAACIGRMTAHSPQETCRGPREESGRCEYPSLGRLLTPPVGCSGP